jgi:hypothetical protein
MRRQSRARHLNLLAGIGINSGAGDGDEGDDPEKHEQREVEGRSSAVGDTFVRPIIGSQEYLLGGNPGVEEEGRRSSVVSTDLSMRESIIGVATTTSIPVSSSKSAICEDYRDNPRVSSSQQSDQNQTLI